MMPVFSVLFTLLLFSELNSQWVATAMPASKIEDIRPQQDGLGLLLNDKPLSEPAMGFLMHRRSTDQDSNIKDDNATPQIVVLSDIQLKGHGISGLTPTFSQGVPLLSDRYSGRFPEYIKIDRRDADLDMLRCMIGRVYRPCWEV